MIEKSDEERNLSVNYLNVKKLRIIRVYIGGWTFCIGLTKYAGLDRKLQAHTFGGPVPLHMLHPSTTGPAFGKWHPDHVWTNYVYL